MIKPISISNGAPTQLLPLLIILTVTALKDIFEDKKRHKSDFEENVRKSYVFKDVEFVETSCQDIKVGGYCENP